MLYGLLQFAAAAWEHPFCMLYIENALYCVVWAHRSSLNTVIGHPHVVMQQITKSSHSHTLTLYYNMPNTHSPTHMYLKNMNTLPHLYRLLTWCYYWNWLNISLSAFIVLYSIYSRYKQTKIESNHTNYHKSLCSRIYKLNSTSTWKNNPETILTSTSPSPSTSTSTSLATTTTRRRRMWIVNLWIH